MTLRLLLISLLLAAGVACVTETGNPELQVSFEGRSTEPEVDLNQTLRSAHLPSSLDSAWVNVEGVRLVEADKCDTAGEIEHEVKGDFTVDLLAEPLVVSAQVTGTKYCRVRIDLDRTDGIPAGAPADLLDNTLFVSGTIADGTRFEIVSRYQGELDLRSRGASFPLGDAQDAIVVAFDIGRWLVDLPIDTATPVGGVLRIDRDANRDLLEAFEDRVEQSIEVFDDAGDDGRVDDDDDLLAD